MTNEQMAACIDAMRVARHTAERIGVLEILDPELGEIFLYVVDDNAEPGRRVQWKSRESLMKGGPDEATKVCKDLRDRRIVQAVLAAAAHEE